MNLETQGLLTDLGTAAALVFGMLAATEVGFRRGRRGRTEGEAKGAGQVGAVQAAVLGLLGLLLGFSFAGAAGRFIERQMLITKEANAIGTAYLRADMLGDVHARELRAALKQYTEYRIDASTRLRGGWTASDAAEVDRQHVRMWKAASEGVKAAPAMAVAVLDPVNEVIDLHSTRMATGRMHLPYLVLGLLIGCSVLALGAIGYGCGLSDRRFVGITIPLVILVGVTLWTIIDLDHPRGGLLRLNDAPLAALKFDGTPEVTRPGTVGQHP